MKSFLAVIAVTFFLLTSCGKGDGLEHKSFDMKLRGTWTSNGNNPLYSGNVVIDYDKITISGYDERQTPPNGDDTRRPFRNITKGIPLSGYSEEGKIYINDAGQIQQGIPYTWWDVDYGRVKFIRINFGDRPETLECRRSY